MFKALGVIKAVPETVGAKVALLIFKVLTETVALPDTLTALALEVTFNVDGLTRAEPLTIGA